MTSDKTNNHSEGNPIRKYETDQELFWAQNFGSEYIERNDGAHLIASNLAFFSRIFRFLRGVESVIELGSNVGLNLHAIKCLLPLIDLAAVEINDAAIATLRERLTEVETFHTSILNFNPPRRWSLVLTKGVLIHINPDYLERVYKLMAKASSRWVLMAEYYNPEPVSIAYRGHSDRLYKRDFAEEFMVTNPEFRLVDYGFSYHGDPLFPQDDVTWFLMEKE